MRGMGMVTHGCEWRRAACQPPPGCRGPGDTAVRRETMRLGTRGTWCGDRHDAVGDPGAARSAPTTGVVDPLLDIGNVRDSPPGGPCAPTTMVAGCAGVALSGRGADLVRFLPTSFHPHPFR